MRKLSICLAVMIFCSTLSGQEKVLLTWYDASVLGIDGKGWSDTKTPFDRLPGKAEKLVPDAVWRRSLNSAGLRVSFTTDSTMIVVRWKLRHPSISSPYMSSMSVAGLDLYLREGEKWHWAATKPPKVFPETTETFIKDLSPVLREYMLYLPSYNGVEKVEIGVVEGAKFGKTVDKKPQKPLVFYGTSIVQGSASSRPGMTYVAQLGRRLDRQIINLGFSGSCRMEPALADLLSELDPSVYVIDCLPNMTAKEISERTVPLVKRLRQARPETPIVLIENIPYSQISWNPAIERSVKTKNKLLSNEYEKLKREGVRNVFYVSGDKLLSAEGNSTVDGVHPTDLGFLQMTDALEPILRNILSGGQASQ